MIKRIHVNQKENLWWYSTGYYEEAIEEVAKAFPSLPSKLAGDIAMMIAVHRYTESGD